MKDPNCTPCQEWELCPFHPADEPPATERLTIGVPMADVPAHAAIVRDPLSAEAQAVLNGLQQAARSRPDIRQALAKAGISLNRGVLLASWRWRWVVES